MKKTILFLMFITSALFAAKDDFQGCIELKLSEAKSIISCPSGDYEVTFAIKP